MRIAPKIMLSNEEEKTLTRLSRLNTASVRVARRAQMSCGSVYPDNLPCVLRYV